MLLERLFGRKGKRGLSESQKALIKLALLEKTRNSRKMRGSTSIQVTLNMRPTKRIALPSPPEISPPLLQQPSSQAPSSPTPVTIPKVLPSESISDFVSMEMKAYIGRIIRVETGEARTRLCKIDLTEPRRFFIIGTSGSGKTNLAKVLIEEYFDKDPEREILVFDIEKEYHFMSLPSDQEELLDEFGVRPNSYPVRVLSTPDVLRAYKSELKKANPDIELFPIKVSPALINSALLQLLSGPMASRGVARQYIDAIMRDYRKVPEKTLDTLYTTIKEAESVPSTFRERLIAQLNNWREIFGHSEISGKIFSSRKINVFFFPSEYFVGSSEKAFWAVFFAQFATVLADSTKKPLLVVIDEGAEYARGEKQSLIVKQELGGLFRRGRKRDIHTIFVINVASGLEDIKANITDWFYLQLPSISASSERKGLFPTKLLDSLTKIPRYHAYYRSDPNNFLALVRIRPAKSYTPSDRRRFAR